MMIVTINFERVKGTVGDISEYCIVYSLFQTWSNIAYKSGIQCPTAGCSTWYPTHIEICKQCNINNTLNTKLQYSIEIKMLQSGVF